MRHTAKQSAYGQCGISDFDTHFEEQGLGLFQTEYKAP